MTKISFAAARLLTVTTHTLLAAALACGFTLTAAQAAEVSPSTSHSSAYTGMGVAQSMSTGAVQWDPAASRELTAALHQMHAVWNTGDIVSLKEMLVGDDVLVSFELDPDTHKPIRLTSKAEIDDFVIRTSTSIDAAGMVTRLEMPRINCRATATFGVCTEECTVNYFKKDSDKIVATDELWSTAVAVKYPEGWRWIQWHMSVASPPQSIEARAIN